MLNNGNIFTSISRPGSEAIMSRDLLAYRDLSWTVPSLYVDFCLETYVPFKITELTMSRINLKITHLSRTTMSRV